jgi:hypothetical protein
MSHYPKTLGELEIGRVLGDMHGRNLSYPESIGLANFKEHWKIEGFVEFDFDHYCRVIEQMVPPPFGYHNKLLVVVSISTYQRTAVVAYSYDGMRAGMATIKPRTTP